MQDQQARPSREEHAIVGMLKATAQIKMRDSRERMMYGAAAIGAVLALAQHFPKYKEVGAGEQLAYLLGYADENVERRRILAAVHACELLEDHAFAEGGGVEEVMNVFRSDSEASRVFEETILQHAMHKITKPL